MTDQRIHPEADADGMQAMVDEVFDDAPSPRVGGDDGDGPTDGDDGDGGGDGRPDRPEGPGRRRVDRTLLGVSLVVAIGLAMVVRGVFVGVSSDERANLPTSIESVSPVPDAVQVLNQSNVVVDLVSGYTGVLVIDGVEIETVDLRDYSNVGAERGQQIQLPAVTIYDAGNATLTFTPSEGAPIEGFDTGEHTGQVIYWPLEDGRARARSYSWTFTVV